MKLIIQAGPLTGDICIGTLSKNGRIINNKTDVTADALWAVAEHAAMFKDKTGDDITISDGDTEYVITVEKIAKEQP